MSIIVSRIPAFVAVYVSRAFSGSPMALRTPEQIAAYLRESSRRVISNSCCSPRRSRCPSILAGTLPSIEQSVPQISMMGYSCTSNLRTAIVLCLLRREQHLNLACGREAADGHA